MAPSRIKLQHILCPTDFSEFSTRAFRHARALAGWFDARLTTAHVIPILIPAWGDPPYFPAPVPVGAAVRDDAAKELSAFVDPAEQQRIAVDTLLLEGDPAREIERVANALPADLLVMGTHGRGGFERLVLGSVTEKLLRRAPCPVLTISGAIGPAREEEVFFKRILCAADLSESSPLTIDFALSLAEENDAELLLLHALEDVRPALLGVRLAVALPDLDLVRENLEREASKQLQNAVPEEARRSCDVRERVVVGRAYKEILRVAEAERADLIVMGTHGHGPIEQWFFGSTSHHVVREASCPVLTVRSMRSATAKEPRAQTVVAGARPHSRFDPFQELEEVSERLNRLMTRPTLPAGE
jgi:nucleotide-binding universal stress UspA family protein